MTQFKSAKDERIHNLTLIKRTDARKVLKCSTTRLLSLEKSGHLEPLRLSGTLRSAVRYRLIQVENLASALGKS